MSVEEPPDDRAFGQWHPLPDICDKLIAPAVTCGAVTAFRVWASRDGQREGLQFRCANGHVREAFMTKD